MAIWLSGFLTEFVSALLNALVKGGVTVAEDSLAGNIKAAPRIMVDAAPAPKGFDEQLQADLDAFKATNK